MRVVIVRHGKADPVSETGEDADRPLAERGEAQAGWLGARLGELEDRPTAVVCSDAVRAHDTARAIGGSLEVGPEIDTRLRVDEPASRAVAVIADHRDNGTLCLVGHNPQLAQLIAVMTGGAAAGEVRLRTGEAWEIEFDPERPIGSGRVVGVHRLDD